MNFRCAIPVLGLVLASVTPSVLGQLITQTVMVHGLQHNEEVKITTTIDLTLNKFTLTFDNRYEGPSDTVGTITSFGFNTPFTNAQLGNHGSNESFTEHWDVKNYGHSTSTWTHVFEPYSLVADGLTTNEDYGVGTGTTPSGGSTSDGIEFGEKVTFVFHFNSDITAQNFKGFEDSAKDIVVRWQDVGKDDDCFRSLSDIGFADLPPAPEPSTYGAMGVLGLIGVVALRRRNEKRAQLKKSAAVLV
jgi:PEP-CTERM motif-containing protein